MSKNKTFRFCIVDERRGQIINSYDSETGSMFLMEAKELFYRKDLMRQFHPEDALRIGYIVGMNEPLWYGAK